MALPNGIVSNQELLDAQTHVWNHIFNFINSMSMKCTIQLGIPDIIHKHGKPMMLAELMEALSLEQEKMKYVERLMRMMVYSKFFIMAKISEKDEKEGYWLTPASILLLKDEPLSVSPFVLAMLDPILTDPWHHVSEWFKTNHVTPFFTTHGMTLWEHTTNTTRLNELFHEGMSSDSRLMTNVIVNDCRHVFEGLKTIVDVGGGTGTMAQGIVNAFPGLKCIVFDLPHVVAPLRDTNIMTYIGGSMFEHIPSGDAIFMKWILHDWQDEECITILKKCKVAIPSKEKGGKVIIIDMVVDCNKDHPTVETQLFYDILMMIASSGKERTEKEWAKLFFDAGFTSYKITHILGSRALIQVFP